MIEINLLRPRIKPPGWQSALEPRDWSAFISRRELLLAIVLLALGLAILRLGFGLLDETADVTGDQASAAPVTPAASEDPPAAAASGTEPSVEDPAPAEDAGGAVDPSEDPPPADASLEPSTLSTPAASPPDPATSQQGPAIADPSPGDPPSSGGRLTQLRQVTQPDVVQVVIIAEGTPEYTTFRVDNPNRVVIDIPGFRVAIPKSQRSQPISHPSMERVRVGQYRADPPVSRIVFDVVSFPDVEISSQPGSLRIRLSPAVE